MTPVAPGKGARLYLMVGSLSAAVVVVLDASGKPALVVEKLWLLRADHHLLGPQGRLIEVLRLEGRPEKVRAVSPAHQHGYNVL